MARRITRKSIKQDEFIEAAFAVGEWIEKHWRTVAYAVGAALALVIVVGGWNWYAGRRAEEAQRLISEGLNLFNGSADPAGARVGRYAEALPLFEKAADRAKGSSAGDVALFYQASSLQKLGRAREAVPLFERVAAHATDRALGDTAKAMLAEAYAKSGDVAKAVETLRALAADPASAYPPDQALLEAGKLLEAQGKDAEARQAWQDVVSKYPQGAAVAEARTLLQPASGKGKSQ